MKHDGQLKTVSEVIDAFGGPKGMCSIFGGKPTRFYNHKAWGKFPKEMHMEIYVKACERGLNIAPELIGMKSIARQGELVLQAAE
jgi:hypothetical protein